MAKKLGFGFMRLPLINPDDQTSIDYEQLKKMVDTFLERGFTYFDTAYMYHNFISEKVLNEVLVKRHPRDTFTVATKMPVKFLKKQEDLARIFDEQLEKCGVDYFDYYLLHNLGVEHYEIAEKFDAFSFIKKKKEYVISNIAITKNFGESSSSDWTLDDITERDLQVSTEVIDTLTKWKQEYNTPPGNSLHSEATPEELAMIEEFKKRGLI